ncbi:MAG TPA: hypothetical protein DEV97_11310 [Lachnospiraceae bacterium]|nr:hypothetical protein [Lachnospiraceae bacterium]
MNPLRQKGKDHMKNSKRKGFGINLIAGALTLAAVTIGSAAGAMAAEDTTTTQLSFDKVFKAQIPTGAAVNDYPSPAEEFGFHSGEATGSTSETADNLASLAAIKGTQWNDSNQIDQVKELDDTTKATVGAKVPETITLASASYSAGEAGSTTKTKAVNVTLTPSKFTSPGIYYYDFHEVVGKTAGVVYDSQTYRIAVTVKNDATTNTPGVIGITLVNKKSKAKNSEIENQYNAGKLTFTKKVAGSLGAKDKEFKVNVMLWTPQSPEKTVGSIITVKGASSDSENSAITPADWTTQTDTEKPNVTRTFTVTDGTSITLTNIPAGVKWLVKEDNYSADGYTTTYTLDGQEYSADTATPNAASTMMVQAYNVVITNTNDTTIDTGVFTTNMPYFLILLAAVGGAVAFIVIARKRRA